MPCLCTANTLRLFVRNVAQVDLPNSARVAASRRFPRRQIPTFDHAHTTRTYSIASKPIYDDLYGDSVESVSESQSRTGERKRPLREQFSDADEENAIIDFSPEAIDALAAEAASGEEQDGHYASNQTYDTPLRSLLKDMPQRKKYVPMEQVPGGIVRRIRPESEGFRLHYSARPNWQEGKERAEMLKKRQEEEAKKKKEEEDARPVKEPWMIEKERAKEKYPDGWNPLKRLSPDAMAGIRALHAQMPEQYTVETLSHEFKVSPEAIRRILKSKWRPKSTEQTDREERWHKRGEKVWTRLADLGVKPPKEWREMGIGAGKPDWMKAREHPRPRAPLPALVTVGRRREAKMKASKEDNLEDRII